jgi:thymidylate kinase
MQDKVQYTRLMIEGVDRVGKSTFIKRLKKILPLDSLHFTKSDPRNYLFYSQTMLKNNVIFDRHFISEYVYSKAFSRPTTLTNEQFNKLMQQAQDLNLKIIILHEDNKVLEKRMVSEEDLKVVENFQNINSLYIALGLKFKNQVLLVKPKKLNKVIRDIKNGKL